MLILVINCGSSSAKYQLFDISRRKLLAKGAIERIGSPVCQNHYIAIERIVKTLGSAAIAGIGHRVVHGQEEFKESALITPKVLRSLEKSSELAPLHNPPSIAGIKACADLLKEIPQVAVFDTSFHHTLPPRAFLYGLPYGLYAKYRIRRYGFHGTSHRFVANKAAGCLKRPLKRLKLITCHLGNGCSMTAVMGGKSIDTSMGFTPLEGLVMGTRSGDIDAAAVLYLMKKERLSINKMNDLLNKRSGLLGISGLSNDMRDLRRAASKGDRRARLAIDIFVYRIKKYIGAYHAAMAGLDAVIFTAGIGENHPWLVKRIERGMGAVVGKKVKFLVIPTNEELLIAEDTYKIINKETSNQ